MKITTMIGIGINTNVVLISAKTTDKGWLELTFDELSNLVKTKKSVFEESQSSTVSNEGQTRFSLNFFPFKKPDGDRNTDKTDEELLDMIGGDIKRLKNQLTQLLMQFMVSDNIKWSPYLGTSVTSENYAQLYLENSTLEMIFHNYATQFIEMAKPFFGDVKYPLRIKLLRQSKDKNFASVPGRFLEDNPWVDLMEIPDNLTKVKFTDWEKNQGLDSSAPVSKADTDAKPKVEDTPQAQTSVFKQR